MVEEKFGRVVAEVRQDIRAAGVPPRCAAGLAAPGGSHALEIIRHYVDEQGDIFEATISIFPAERFTYALKLERRRSA
jgi:DNA-binding GntR family transcriptional regulator